MNSTLRGIRRFALAALLLILSLTLLAPVSAQDATDGGTIYFLGRVDGNSDGLIDPADGLTLYRGQSGSEAAALSSPDADVRQFSVSADGSLVAYTVRSSGGFGVNVVNATGNVQATGDLLGQTSIGIDTFDDAVWVVGLNAAEIPVLTGFSTTDGTQIGQHTFRAPNTSVSVHSSGDYVLAFNASTGGLSVLRLPSMELVQFPLTGYAATAPVWSPTEPKFVMGISPDTSFSNVQVSLIDVSTGAATTLYQPDFTSNAPLQLNWSENGTYVVVLRPADTTNPSGIRLINAATGTVNRLEQPEVNMSVAAWSADDSYLLLSVQPIAADSLPILTLYTLETQTGVAVNGLLDYNVAAVAWQPNEAETPMLAALGQSRQTGQYSLVVLDPVSGEVTTLFDGIDISLLTSPLLWSGDGAHVFFVANSNDTVFTSLGTPTALFAVESGATGMVERVSPENVVIDTLVLQSR